MKTAYGDASVQFGSSVLVAGGFVCVCVCVCVYVVRRGVSEDACVSLE